MNQRNQVINVMRENGGFATLGFLNQKVDVREWKTKTPFASIRRIVQDENYFFRIRPGLWALNDCREEVLRIFKIERFQKTNTEFDHSYYQGLLLEIGNMKGFQTYVPAQDKNRHFLRLPLFKISSTTAIYEFSYPEIVNRAKSIDVIWFNERKLPQSFFEVEHSTDIQNSLLKFNDLRDFNANFFIISAIERKREFDRKIRYSAFDLIVDRVKFFDYESLSILHSKTLEINSINML
jgi:hypothetical protein